MPFITAEDDCEIYYEDHGSGEALVFIPGFAGVVEVWRNQLPQFSARYRCVALDLRGCGRSDKPLPRVSYGVHRHKQDVRLVLKTLGVTKCVLVGHSMGGCIALRYFLDHPPEVKGIVLAGSFAAGEQIKHSGRTIETYRGLMETKQSRVNAFKDVGVPEDLALETAKWPLYAIMGNAWAFLEFDITTRIKEIVTPTLIIHGDSDAVTPFHPCATYLAENIPKAILNKMANINHCPQLEAPEEFNRLLADFLRKTMR